MGGNAPQNFITREFTYLSQICSFLQMRKLRLKGINKWTKALPGKRGQSLNLNPHLSVEKFEAI